MFVGSGAALITPFQAGKVDEAALRKLINIHIEKGTDFLVPCGTTGESATLSHEEHDRVIEITVQEANGRVPVLAGAGSNNTAEAIRLTLKAKEVGANGTLQISPYYNKPNQRGLVEHFKAIAACSDLPLVLYNIQGRTGVRLSTESIRELSQVKNIVGIKEANGCISAVSDIIEATHKDFLVLSGDDGISFPMYILGAKGSISVSANVLPTLNAKLWDCVEARDWEEAKKIHFQLSALNKVLFIDTNPIPVKTALALMGICQEEFRLPLLKMTEGDLNELKTILKKYQLI